MEPFPQSDDMGVPEIARLEIRLEGSDLSAIAANLRYLAGALDAANRMPNGMPYLVAYRHIRAASKKLRGSN